jgi:hypothetical protein
MMNETAKPSVFAGIATWFLVVFLTIPVWSASTELKWTEPFVVRSGEIVVLKVVGRRLPKQGNITVLYEGKPDKTVTVLDWERRSPRAAQLTLQIGTKAIAGLRGLELRLGPKDKVTQAAAFRVVLPIQLPWPHEPPNATPGKSEELRDQVFIINNFGLYQGSGAQAYFHDGLDIILPKETPVYAITDGIVRSYFLSPNVGSRYIAVEDLQNPGFGWIYVHTDKFRHSIGASVRRGEQIAVVADFDGLEHIHLSRTFVPNGDRWSRIQNHHNVFADDFFELRDAESPVIHPRLFLFPNESNQLLPLVDGKSVASGDVDIVIGIRDRGHYARSKDPNFPPGQGDRLAPTVIRCDVFNSKGERVAQWIRDWTRTILRWTDDQTSIFAPDRVKVVFKSAADVGITPQLGNWHSYYVMTNSAGINPMGEVDPSDSQHSWRTGAVNNTGERIFPDGTYTIWITAWDSVGNRSTYRTRIELRN